MNCGSVDILIVINLSIVTNALNKIFFVVNLFSAFLLIFATLALYFSFIIDFNYYSIFASVILSVILTYKFSGKIKEVFHHENIGLVPAAYILLVGLIFAFILGSQSLSLTSLGYMVGGGGMYGDSALHAAYTSRILTGEFPLLNPLFGGKILVYPYANDLLSAILIFFKFDLGSAFFWPQVFFFMSFMYLFYKFVSKFSDIISFFFSSAIFFLGWGVGFLYFLKEQPLSLNLFSSVGREYTNNVVYNLNFHNVLTGLILPERSFLPGLVLGLGLILFIYDYFEKSEKKNLLVAFSILGILPFWHTHTFIFFSFFMLIFLIVRISKKTTIKFIRDFVIGSVIGFILLLPFLYLFLSNHSTSGFLRLSLGWMNGNENLALYWLRNSWLILPLAAISFFTLKGQKKFYFICAFFSFLVANFVIFQPWEWDNIKILSLSFLFFSILVGKLMSDLFRKNVLLVIPVLLLLASFIFSGSLSLALQLKNKFTIYDRDDIALADWAKNATGADDIFLGEAIPNQPIPGLSGRQVYMGYPGHLWVHGIDYSAREVQINNIYAGNVGLIGELDPRVDYFVVPSRLFYLFETLSGLVFENSKYRVYRV